MERCEICNREFKNILALATHIGRSHPISKEEYYIKYLGKQGLCKRCGEKTAFINMREGFSGWCSITCMNKDVNRIERIKSTCINKYGSSSPLHNPDIKNIIREKCIINYGCENQASHPSIKNKIKETCNEKYGGNGPYSDPKIREKGKMSCLKNFGYENPLQNPLIKNIVRDKKLKETWGDDFEKLYKTFINFNVELIDDEYINVDTHHNWKCLLCNETFQTSLFNIANQNYLCPFCYPRTPSISGMETDLISYITDLLPNDEIIKNSRKIIRPKELDIYIPSKSIAIEFNGIYWHDENHVGKDYHLNKTNECKNKDIQLIHIFEDEWEFKKEIFKSYIKRQLNIYNDFKKIPARRCVIKEISNDDKKIFHSKYAINLLHDDSYIGIGAFYNDELIALIEVKKLNDKKWNFKDIIIHNDFHINGIRRKFINYFKMNYIWNTIFINIDYRLSYGKEYKLFGFKFFSISKPHFSYIDKTKRNIYGKINHNRIYDCGILKLILNK